MSAKGVLLTIGLAIGGLAWLGYRKVKSLKAVFDNMTIAPSGIRNLKLGIKEVSFLLDFTITNPASEAFSVSGASIASLNRIMVYKDGNLIGMATVNMGAIEIPSNGELTIKNVPFKIATESALNLLLQDNIDINKLTILAVIDVLGNEYTIEG